MKNQIKITIFLTLLWITPVFAHGEHKPGPHGGEIRMPGAFHTEVLPYQNLGFKVYLLDINFMNPISKNSKIEGKVVSAGKETMLKCTGHPDHFYCELPKGNTVSIGELILSPVRNSEKGADVKYKLPIQFNEIKEDKNKQEMKGVHNHG